jgi:ubiquinone/menaquinone biosynthesis C-methylase UbiE
MPEMPATAKKALASAPYQLFTRRVVVPWVLQGERPAGEGLEIGAGSGAMTAQLLTAFPGLRMVATDYDADMVRVARQTVAPFADRAIVEQADASALPFEAGRFDLVLSAAMLHHVGEWENALAEIMRVLRPGGRLIGYDLLDTTPIRLMHIGRGHATRLLRRAQLEAELHRLGFVIVAARTGLPRSLGGTMMATLSLPGSLYLLAYDTRKNELAKRAWLDYLVRGAMLCELIIRGHLVEVGRRPHAMAVNGQAPAGRLTRCSAGCWMSCGRTAAAAGASFCAKTPRSRWPPSSSSSRISGSSMPARAAP